MAYCRKCGEKLLDNASYCGKCGAAVLLRESEAEGQQNSNAQTNLADREEQLRLFVGKNYDYFQKKWKIGEQNRSNRSWNWAAFFAGFFWMAYRKMYLFSWIFIGVIVIETLLEYAIGFSDKLSNAINIGISVTFGWQGNYWYKLHCEKKIREITTTLPEQSQIELAKQGGTNIGAAIGFTVMLIVLLGLVAVVAEH